ncbi:DNA polymerase III subunit delta' [Legionella sp. MW5194]|uniref:DNA polymerase III subunit delta' C-terminal domain-containing protein n=1 Tax=Legionella sp. MW5194 TaxID=2662448 RepID=UPI00193D5D9A|nr:DNA polymerase III subunit delta' C-terminal domain-containing protein [Legionella sp. MW5194]QRN03821.1 DNA polymerase III subunit delta' [Legionella sp. MW5194]
MPHSDPFERCWLHFEQSHAHQRLTHGHLFCADDESRMNALNHRLMQLLLCHNPTKPCQQCQSCRLVAVHCHPDVTLVQPEKEGGAIKIEQIRALQTIAYTSAQLGAQRVIVIKSAEKLNNAAANALLKLLEEPPPGVYFLLQAQFLGTLPATVLSRCQLWRLYDADEKQDNYLALGQRHAEDTAKGKVFSQQSTILEDLQALLTREESACSLAAKWASHDFPALLWFLSLLHAHLIYLKLMQKSDDQAAMNTLASSLSVPVLFGQIDKINGIFKKINHTISVNQLLALENLLLGYHD